MALDDPELKRLMLDLLTTPSKRTKQKTIGASGIGNPCPYCLAQSLLGGQGQLSVAKKSPYWLGAKIGDAIHKLLETEGLKHKQQAQHPYFQALVGASFEETIYIGTIPGYGDIYSTPDLYIDSENHLVDYKTSKRSKVQEYLVAGVPVQYLYQVQLYAMALEAMGKRVDKISFVFINRDGVGDNDVNVISLNYDPTLAKEAWDRVELAWQWLVAGNDPDTLPSDPNCFVCGVLTKRI